MASLRTKYLNKAQRHVLAEWRGIDEPDDWTGHEHGIASVLEKIFAKAQFEERITEEELAPIWKAAVPDFVAQHSKAISLNNGILHVAVLQASIRYTLTQMRSRILPKLKHAVPGQEIREIRFRLG